MLGSPGCTLALDEESMNLARDTSFVLLSRGALSRPRRVVLTRGKSDEISSRPAHHENFELDLARDAAH